MKRRRKEKSAARRRWVTGLVADRSGIARYTVLIRAPDDPERMHEEKDYVALWRRRLIKDTAETWFFRIGDHLLDGVARTMNRIGVELLDKTADNLFETPFEEGLWQLVEERHVEHTMDAPVLFRMRPESIGT